MPWALHSCGGLLALGNLDLEGTVLAKEQCAVLGLPLRSGRGESVACVDSARGVLPRRTFCSPGPAPRFEPSGEVGPMRPITARTFQSLPEILDGELSVLWSSYTFCKIRRKQDRVESVVLHKIAFGGIRCFMDLENIFRVEGQEYKRQSHPV